MEQAMREGEKERVAAMLPPLVAMLEQLMADLARVAPAEAVEL
jgi:hypothetical protein